MYRQRSFKFLTEKQEPIIRIQRITEFAKIPYRITPQSAELDLIAAYETSIRPNGYALVLLDLMILSIILILLV